MRNRACTESSSYHRRYPTSKQRAAAEAVGAAGAAEVVAEAGAEGAAAEGVGSEAEAASSEAVHTTSGST